MILCQQSSHYHTLKTLFLKCWDLSLPKVICRHNLLTNRSGVLMLARKAMWWWTDFTTNPHIAFDWLTSQRFVKLTSQTPPEVVLEGDVCGVKPSNTTKGITNLWFVSQWCYQMSGCEMSRFWSQDFKYSPDRCKDFEVRCQDLYKVF